MKIGLDLWGGGCGCSSASSKRPIHHHLVSVLLLLGSWHWHCDLRRKGWRRISRNQCLQKQTVVDVSFLQEFCCWYNETDQTGVRRYLLFTERPSEGCNGNWEQIDYSFSCILMSERLVDVLAKSQAPVASQIHYTCKQYYFSHGSTRSLNVTFSSLNY